MDSAKLDARPKLAPKAKLRFDAKTSKYVLLYPEKGLILNATGAAIVKLCSGERTLREIIDELAHEFHADPPVLRGEVLLFVQVLRDRGLLQDPL